MIGMRSCWWNVLLLFFPNMFLIQGKIFIFYLPIEPLASILIDHPCGIKQNVKCVWVFWRDVQQTTLTEGRFVKLRLASARVAGQCLALYLGFCLTLRSVIHPAVRVIFVGIPHPRRAKVVLHFLRFCTSCLSEVQWSFLESFRSAFMTISSLTGF